MIVVANIAAPQPRQEELKLRSLVEEQSELVVELNVMPANRPRRPRSGAKAFRSDDGDGDGDNSAQNGIASEGCEPGDRLRPARDRSQLCYWFRLTKRTATATMNGSLGSLAQVSRMSAPAPPNRRHQPELLLLSDNERLIEAELHLFKLAPDPELLRRHQAQVR